MTSRVFADRYELGPVLGTGGMATVYEASDRLLHRRVAVKLLRPEILAEPTARRRFLAEARAAASLSHAHAVAVYDVGSSAEEPFIVMELVRGGTLEDILADGTSLPEQQALAIGSQVLGALAAAHRQGLVHRDVKPANILLPDNVVPETPEEMPGVKLADFGIAKAAREAAGGLTATGQVLGTPKYLSPEQVEGRPATPQSDLYATGVVLYEMLAGRPPFESDSALGLLIAHREEEATPLDRHRPDLHPQLVALVHRALAKDPAGRPVDAQEMRKALLARRGQAPALAEAGAAAPAATQPMTSVQEPTEALRTEEPAFRAAGTAPVARPAPTIASGRIALWIGLFALLGIGLLFLVQALGRVMAGGNLPGVPQQQEEPAPGDGEQPAGDGQEPAPGAVEPGTEPEGDQESPPAVPPSPEDLPTEAQTLRDLFQTPDLEAGERARDVRRRVTKILLREDLDRRLRDFAELRDDVEEWVDDGELERRFADLVLRSLEPLVGAGTT